VFVDNNINVASNVRTHTVGLPWTSDEPEAETSTWQHTTHTRDKHPCPRRGSNPQSQLASGRRPMSYTARPLELPSLAPAEFCERERRNANIYERQTENINIYKPLHTETLVAIPTKLPTAAFLCHNIKKKNTS